MSQYFADENDNCEEQGDIAEEKENALYAAFAASPCQVELEKAYFGERLFLRMGDITDHFIVIDIYVCKLNLCTGMEQMNSKRF